MKKVENISSLLTFAIIACISTITFINATENAPAVCDKIVRQSNEIDTYDDARSLAINIIKECEGFKSTVYKCYSGKRTIGYGMTGKHLRGRTEISMQEAENDLIEIYNTLYENISSKVTNECINDYQIAALVSFAYNIGEYGLYRSTMFRLINDGNADIAANEFDKFVYSTNPATKQKVKLKGLEKRRSMERRLFEH